MFILGIPHTPISVVVLIGCGSGWMDASQEGSDRQKALQALKRRREVVSLVLGFFRKRDKVLEHFLDIGADLDTPPLLEGRDAFLLEFWRWREDDPS